MERKFLVLLRRYRLQNEHLYYSICGSLELFVSPSLRRDEALPLGVLWWFETLWLRLLVVITQRILWIVLGTNKSLCACPARPVRAQILAVFRKYYKTAGIAPFSSFYHYQNTIRNIQNQSNCSKLSRKQILLSENLRRTYVPNQYNRLEISIGLNAMRISRVLYTRKRNTQSLALCAKPTLVV